MPRCNAADEDPEIEAIWSYPRNKLIGTLVRINQHQSIRFATPPLAMITHFLTLTESSETPTP